MREIKFRCWDLENKKWHTPTEWGEEPADAYIGYGEIPEIGFRSNNFYAWLQFTGLHDKNGKEIYEGDIVQWGTEDEILSCVVEYTEGAHDSEECPYMSGFSYRVIDAIDYPEDDEGETDYVTEVIGNIYDNPELLKESNK